MLNGSELALLAGVVAVGVLHTMVPDHWAPIALLARQRGWSRGETARAALQAGIGHVLTTLAFGIAVWLIGTAAAERYGTVIDAAASAALVGFGLWIAIGAWREMRAEGDGHHGHSHTHSHPHPHDHGGHHAHEPADANPSPAWTHDPLYAASRGTEVAERHTHLHRHGNGPAHLHWHDHAPATAHAIALDTVVSPPLHQHRHKTTGRTALLLLLGSSPMVEGIPAFFAASRYGIGLIALMSVLFAASTIATYVVLSVYSASGLQRLNLGPIERYGEVASGVFIALMGLVFGLLTL
ncbi:MAG: hypothetical protein ABI377_05100 [Devosia sp.]